MKDILNSETFRDLARSTLKNGKPTKIGCLDYKVLIAGEECVLRIRLINSKLEKIKNCPCLEIREEKINSDKIQTSVHCTAGEGISVIVEDSEEEAIMKLCNTCPSVNPKINFKQDFTPSELIVEKPSLKLTDYYDVKYDFPKDD